MESESSIDVPVTNLLVVGLPESGKTSFIQALDEVLKHPQSPSDLQADGLALDRTYLQSGKVEFLAGKKIGRTQRPLLNTAAELWFRHPPSGRRGRLQLPDRKGEIFRDHWCNRQWEKSFKVDLPNVHGALVFLRADEAAHNDERLGVLAKEVEPAKSITPWDMRNASAQVQLVDVLQFISEFGNAPLPLRVAVMIAAWDTLGGAGDIRPKNPSKFLDREWSLLSQYLRSNPEIFTTRVFGFSAYGGMPGNLGHLLDVAPHERVRLAVEDSISRDLSLPLRWLLQLPT